MKQYNLIIFFLMIIFICPLNAQSSENYESVTVLGEAVIYNGNKPQAKERALQEAFSTAITQVMGSYITAESFTQNYVSIDRSVLSKTKGYVKKYEILELKEEPEILSIKLMVMVSAESVKDDLTALGILLDAAGNPVIEITGEDQGLDMSVSIPVFKQILSAKGFYMIDKNKGTGPDVVIQVNGKITTKNIVAGSGFHGAVVELNGKAVRKSTQNLIASESTVSNGAGLSESAALKQAYQQAAESLASKLVDAVSEKWGQELTSGKTLSLTAKVDSYNKVQVFTKHLTRIFGVKKVDMKSFKNGDARYLVRFTGQSKTLADLILKISSQNINVSVNGFDSDSIELSVN